MWLWLLAFSAAMACAQQPFQTEAVAPERFVAVHGRKAVVMGYAGGGLEAWAYPLQLVSGYEAGFRAAGSATETSAAILLRRVTYEPQAITRTYIGPDFIVRERLFIPLNEAAVLFTYTVECRHPVDIVIHFTPVLDLMWPMALGGQSTQWNPASSAYLLSDGTRRYAAMIGSPSITTHDETMNTVEPGAPGNRFAFTVQAGGEGPRTATIVVAQLQTAAAAQASAPAARMAGLIRGQADTEAEAGRHYAAVAADALKIVTPDAAVNQQLAWAQTALDQAWVCNPVLGCGLVAGYGPSRNARRPQYDWFFAGDGLLAVEALVSTGAYDRAREELAFIANYQDSATGMVWHEMSQSADPADWATRYPYMFVHVEITFQYLVAVEHYVSASGDLAFLQAHWAGIDAAYRYCSSLLKPADGLPRIPAGKLGGDEQDKITDDLSLSVSWIAASSAFSRLAQLNGQQPLAKQAQERSQQARVAAASHYWSDAGQVWIDGYNEAGQPITRRGDGGIRLTFENILDAPRRRAILDRMASTDFQTDWGARGVATSSSQFDPSSYAKGSVSAMSTANIAAAFWSQHRPVTGFALWSALLPWGTLESMGHMHELLAGDYYHQQAESVPEQTWSSAAFLSAAANGLLGLGREAATHELVFAPHLPPGWNALSVENIKVPGGKVALQLTRTADGLTLVADNSGAPLPLRFAPEVPLGAHLLGAAWSGHSVPARLEEHEQDEHASIAVRVPSGHSQGAIHFAGGASATVTSPPPLVGETSHALRITSEQRHGSRLELKVDVPLPDGGRSAIVLRTTEIPTSVKGATLSAVAPGVYQLQPDGASPAQAGTGQAAGTLYRSVAISIELR